MSDYRATEAEFPELRLHRPFSSAWYRLWRDLHLAKYPDADEITRANLTAFIEQAADREGTAT